MEWTEIIVIFMPIFIPLLDNFGVDPLFFGLLVALNLQTAFLSPPVAMAAFYLKGVSPPHVTLNQIFAGMLPFMGIQVVAIILLYQFPQHRPVAAAPCCTNDRLMRPPPAAHRGGGAIGSISPSRFQPSSPSAAPGKGTGRTRTPSSALCVRTVLAPPAAG